MGKMKNEAPLGRRRMEAAGSLTPDLEEVSKSYQHLNRAHTGHSAPNFDRTGRLAVANNRVFWLVKTNLEDR